jgi:hypothetical protein
MQPAAEQAFVPEQGFDLAAAVDELGELNQGDLDFAMQPPPGTFDNESPDQQAEDALLHNQVVQEPVARDVSRMSNHQLEVAARGGVSPPGSLDGRDDEWDPEGYDDPLFPFQT